VEILMDLEDHLREKINPAMFNDARTVQDMVNLLKPLWK
jgi:acyl carrier protein